MYNKLIFVFKSFAFLIILSSCGKSFNKNATHQNTSDASIEKGEGLAKMYCQSCHLLPDPSLITSGIWEKGILPNMGPRLGIFIFNNKNYPNSRNDRDLDPSYYPTKPLLSNEQWQNIIDYYTAVSPDSMPPQPKKAKINNSLTLFEADTTVPHFYYPSATTFLKINPPNTKASIVVSDVIKKSTYFLDKNNKIIDSFFTNGPIVDIDFNNNNFLTCNIGILNPNNGKHGKGQYVNRKNLGMQLDSSVLFDTLRRPVQITSADFNQDGKMDYIICEFGFLNGSFSWMENLGNNKFKKHVLRNLPGAIKAYVNDYNHDGLPDIWVLFAQADECIMLYTNKGNGKFEEKQLLHFPSINGSSYFELADFNKDGFQDILYTCGDNADYSPVLKPYHGVYIFMNDKTNHFKQQYFYPINGCYKAMARDFDNDGDLDIATISFFADYQHQPEEGFVYLKNNGNLNFTPYSLRETQKGRWLSMDVGDINGDGKIDIILGNFSIGPSFTKSGYDWKKYPPYLILRNTGKLN